MEKERNGTGANDHLANERTFLAWVRTSVGIMAFGFVVVKFSLFVKQMSIMFGKESTPLPHSYSGAVGIFLVAVGTITSGLAYFSYRRTARHLRDGKYEHSTLMTTLLMGFIFLVSLLVIVYLIETT